MHRRRTQQRSHVDAGETLGSEHRFLKRAKKAVAAIVCAAAPDVMPNTGFVSQVTTVV